MPRHRHERQSRVRSERWLHATLMNRAPRACEPNMFRLQKKKLQVTHSRVTFPSPRRLVTMDLTRFYHGLGCEVR